MALAFMMIVCQGGPIAGGHGAEIGLDRPVQTEIRLHESLELENIEDGTILNEEAISDGEISDEVVIEEENYEEENIEAYKNQNVYANENNGFSHEEDVNIKAHKENTKEYLARASWYGPGFHGRRTANGEIFDQNDLTAAHKELAFGTKVKVTNLQNGKSIIVKINDRGPYINGRHLDLSKGAAQKIDMIEAGVVDVKMEIIQ